MEAITGSNQVMHVLSLAGLTGAREVRPIAPVRTPLSGDLTLQPDTYEPGTAEQPLPNVTYGARRRAYGA
ncbi:MAG: hypothetical protein HZA61_03390 [Candidatus Eisenbacteria bacterium]|uniref:Uncharacterized protein n=1 Tax=Eiseniibacteriota bacterium TaxID=2212470 RepID=A0A933S9M2_UNCEI|nr:hypothetical protein [Candidatus Eisenbacteria bacterium]